MKLALAQLPISPNPEDNIAAAQRFATTASEQNATILAFPEMFMALPRKNVALATVAEPLDGPFVTALQDLARKHHLYVVAGVWERIPQEERVGNVIVMLSPQGELLTAYRKLHLFDALNVRESDTMIAGKTLPEVIPVADFKIGLAICYDLRFPELFRYLAFQGANAILLPSAWYAGTLKEDHWLTLLRARAIENTCYVAAVNAISSSFCGRSAAFDPFGVQIADAGEQEQILIVELQAERLHNVRAKLPVLAHVRSDLCMK
ncbi:hypothetical protein U27_01829 [Candidatus Vecturithrix granuli]|uniref:CN hydrolase domain-containing protein n=1 Tax=Vecturithrix granuli TaxID=1499967 RepID=A0A0S6WAR1_VECG1|nr:hypothetical protein U27_01829 [Candidatus Vecturithrix granuli]